MAKVAQRKAKIEEEKEKKRLELLEKERSEMSPLRDGAFGNSQMMRTFNASSSAQIGRTASVQSTALQHERMDRSPDHAHGGYHHHTKTAVGNRGGGELFPTGKTNLGDSLNEMARMTSNHSVSNLLGPRMRRSSSQWQATSGTSRMSLRDAIESEHMLQIDNKIDQIESRQTYCKMKKERQIQNKSDKLRY